MSDQPPPIGSIWRSASGRLYVVQSSRIAHAAEWYAWVDGRSTPLSKKEWAKMRMISAAAGGGEAVNYAGKIPFGRFIVCRDANNKWLTGSPLPIGNKDAAPDSVSPTITIKVVVADGKAMADGIVNSRPSSDDIRAAINVLEEIRDQLKPKEDPQP